MNLKAQALGATDTVGRSAKKAYRRGVHAAAPVLTWWDEVGSVFFEGPRKVAARVVAIPTWLGWVALGGGVFCLAMAARWNWVEMAVLGLVLVVLTVLAMGFLVGRTAFDASLDLARSRVVVGERAVGAITLTNPSSRAMWPVQVELPVGSGLATFDVPRLAPGQTHEDLFTIPTSRRGVLKVGPVSAVRGDPLGLLARVTTWTDPVDLYVHPRTVSLDGSSAGLLQDLEGLPTRDLSNADVSFHALREYVAGDDRRYIHWRSSARTGTLMVRQFEETRRSHLAIGLSANSEEYPDASDFELAVSSVGSLGLQAVREEKQLTVMVQAGTIPSRTGKQYLDGLSGVDLTPPRRGSIIDLALALGQAVPGASVAVLACGSDVTPAQIRRASSHIPLGVQTVVLICDPQAGMTRRNIGDTVVLTVSELAELPVAMRRIAA